MNTQLFSQQPHSKWRLTMVLALAALTAPVHSAPLTGTPATYTSTADFNNGTGINVDTSNDEVKLDDTVTPFNFIWIAASTRGTIIKVDTQTGAILGEYLSAPSGMGTNPSRTTVDANGNVWAGNRVESGGDKGSIVHVGLVENGQCVDRNGSGVIETSSGPGDIKPWTNAGSADSNGGVSTADDECIIHYVRTAGTAVRTVAVDAGNDIWVGGFGNGTHEKIDSSTGLPVIGTQFNLGCGGYGGLMDANGVLWSASLSSNLMRYDTNTMTGACINIGVSSYGLGIDTNGFIWNTNFGFNTVMKIAANGVVSGTFPTGGGSADRGVAVTPADNNVWVANSGGSDVTRLDNNGAIVAIIPVGLTPTGVSVDGGGKVWVTNLNSDNAMRINPATNTVDLTVDLGAGAGPYNYSDMTGSTLIAPPDAGTWSIVHDTLIAGVEWGTVSWNATTPGDSSINVTAASGSDGITFGPAQSVTNGVDLTIANGQYIKVDVSLNRSTNSDADGNGIFDSPVMYDLTIEAITNEQPVCDQAYADKTMLWPPNHKFNAISIMGVYDPDAEPVTITIDSIFQDEPVKTKGDGNTSPDGMGVGSDTAHVRAERSGSKKIPGDGRVYHIGFTAADAAGDSCSGEVTVGVPHDKGKGSVPVDGGALYDSTMP